MNPTGRDSVFSTPPAKSTRSHHKTVFYELDEEKNRRLQRGKRLFEQNQKEIEAKFKVLQKSIKRQQELQRRRSLNFDMAQAEEAAPTQLTETEMAFVPRPFLGTSKEDAQAWLSYIERYMTYKDFSNANKLSFFKLLLREGAADWLEGHQPAAIDTYAKVSELFKSRYVSSDLLKWQKATEIFDTLQGAHETVDDYATKIKKKAKAVPLADDVVRYAITRGLRPFIKAHVIQANAKTLEEVLDRARAAELTEVHQPAGLDKINEEIRTNHRLLENEIKKLADRIGNTSVHSIDSDDEGLARYKSRSPKRVTFDDRSRSAAPTAYRYEADTPFGTQTHTEFADRGT